MLEIVTLEGFTIVWKKFNFTAFKLKFLVNSFIETPNHEQIPGIFKILSKSFILSKFFSDTSLTHSFP